MNLNFSRPLRKSRPPTRENGRNSKRINSTWPKPTDSFTAPGVDDESLDRYHALESSAIVDGINHGNFSSELKL